jgi:peptide/nickel transport system substrate-binding protein
MGHGAFPAARLVGACAWIAGVVVLAIGSIAPISSAQGESSLKPPKIAHGIAQFGAPALSSDFSHFPYANPDAPKGGRIRLGIRGSFANLNALNMKFMGGGAPAQLWLCVYEPLMTRSQDEPNSLYGLVAKSVEFDEAREHITFRLDSRARFSDGVPISSDDVLFTFDLLKAKGRTHYRSAFSRVRAVETPDTLTIRFDLTGAADRDLPIFIAAMPVLPKHATDVERFEEASLTPPVASGPYVVSEIKQGEHIVLRRNPNYWAKDIPSRRGLFNFDEIDLEYYRDDQTMFEAFKSGLLDFWWETNSSRWAGGYDTPAVREARVVRETLPVDRLDAVKGFAFNLRNPSFRDIRLREAIAMMFDFEWINANYYANGYARTTSFFEGTDFSAFGAPASQTERALLNRYPGAVRDEILEGRWRPPVHDGTGRDREPLLRARQLLTEAGYRLTENGLAKDGIPLRFEILVRDREEERLALHYSASLRKIGVDAQVRILEETAYANRRQTFHFDMIVVGWALSAMPGREQELRWSSTTSNQPVTANVPGVSSKAVDGAIDALLAAQSYEDLVSAARVLDRLLISGFYVVPLFHAADKWIAYSSDLARPAREPIRPILPFGLALENWWKKRGKGP